MRFLNRLSGQAGVSSDNGRPTSKRRSNGLSKKLSNSRRSARNNSRDEERMPADETQYRGRDRRERSLSRNNPRREQSEERVPSDERRRASSRKRKEKVLRGNRRSHTQRSGKTVRRKSKSKRETNLKERMAMGTRRSKSKNTRRIDDGRRVARSSSPAKKKNFSRSTQKSSRYSSLPPPMKKERRSRKQPVGRRAMGKDQKQKERDWEPAEPDWEPSEDLILASGNDTRDSPQQDAHEQEHDIPHEFLQCAMLPTDSSRGSIVDKNHKMRPTKSYLSETVKTMSFEDARGDGCVAEYDTVFSRMFDWVADDKTLDTRNASRIQRDRSELNRQRENSGGYFLDTLCVEADLSTVNGDENRSYEILSVDDKSKELMMKEDETCASNEDERFHWKTFFF